MVICTTCSARVDDGNKIAHFKSNWHVYNLKRVVAKLLPISEDAYVSKKLSFKNEDEASLAKNTHCQACKRSFLNNKSFEAHLTSGKHIKNVKLKDTLNSPPPLLLDKPAEDVSCPASSPMDSDTTDSTPQALPLGSCLFCEKRILPSGGASVGPDDQRALAYRILGHMTDAHKFTVPYPDRLVDPAGLLLELGRIVGQERACLCCGRQFYGRRFPPTTAAAADNAKVSLMAVRNHMLHKDGHLRVWCGTDDPVEMALALNRAEVEKEDGSEDDEDYISPNAALAGGELFSQFYDQSVVIPSFILPQDIEDDAYEVRLPSGTVISHRAMQTVYRQHLGNSLALVDHNALSRRRHDALPTALSGERLPLQSVQCRSTAVVLALPRHTPIPLVSRATERRREEWAKRFDLETGVRGNLVNRMHIRRQY